MTQFYAQPYDISAAGFYFESMEEYDEKYAACKNDFGGQVEEFEIQFIDGEEVDAALFKALGIYQGDIGKFFEIIEEWDDDQKIKVIIAVGEVGYRFSLETDDPDGFEIDVYEMDDLKDLAIQFVEDGLFGEIPTHLEHYIDYDAIAHDLGMDYSQTLINKRNYIYRMD